MISFRSVRHGYGNNISLKFQDWTLQQGEPWLLLGNSGSGKTTLLHILTGLLKPQQGEVLVKGTNLYQLRPKELDLFRGRNIGLILQRAHLIRSLTVLENLLLAQSFAGLPTDRQLAKATLASLHMEEKINRYPHQLSQGQLQRVSIARAVLHRPALLVADEPTSSLDDKNAEAVLQLLLCQARATAATLVVATHDQRVKTSFSNQYSLPDVAV
ncbi:ATP-binding cassette domain-containing protein [Pontibacter qinzhouensis]|uniref:ATP-binding cassette domain-containing protein n=1 Tax=Pontibacter qinzhouensis TaxID=2603253 RepID=A0A5C8JM99_9BACT|nr:ATP-binding cassette domain-containing protein [Pontibacter qinzhouensis]TXK38146.1 ATP-binding cassette domain-containing protein [Pontibacter qinzhouensis]